MRTSALDNNIGAETDDEDTKDTKTIIAIIISTVAFIVAVGTAYVWYSHRNDSGSESDSPNMKDI